jgi:hypothetical protein
VVASLPEAGKHGWDPGALRAVVPRQPAAEAARGLAEVALPLRAVAAVPVPATEPE